MIIVTGGAGFIGSNVLHALRPRTGEALVCADRFGTDDKWRNLARAGIDDVVLPEDLPAYLSANSDAIRAIVHLGAISATTERDVDLIARTNIALTRDLFDWCTDRRKQFIYASSAATYGGGEEGFEDDDRLEALLALKPLNAYGWSKHMSDLRIARIRASGGRMPLQCLGLKFFNVYGPNEYHKADMMSVVARILPTAAAGEPVTLFRSHRPGIADGGQARDFVYVKDCADIIAFVLDAPSVSGLMNIGTGSARSFKDLAHAVFAALNRTPRISFIDTPLAIRDKYQYFTEAKIDRLRAAGYARPMTGLEDGVLDYVQSHLLKDDRYL